MYQGLEPKLKIQVLELNFLKLLEPKPKPEPLFETLN